MNKNDAGQVFLRVILGLTFFIHGVSKFQGGIGNTAGFFDSLGIPGFMAYIVAGIELIGGLAVILGLGNNCFRPICGHYGGGDFHGKITCRFSRKRASGGLRIGLGTVCDVCLSSVCKPHGSFFGSCDFQ